MASGADFHANWSRKLTRTSIAAWILMIVSCVAALSAIALAFHSFVLSNEVLAANPHCATLVGDLLYVQSILAQLYVVWLISGASGALSLSCALMARRIVIHTPHIAQRTASTLLVLSSLALLCLAVSFAWFQIVRYANCIG